MNKTLKWLDSLLQSMGNALFNPFKDNEPPSIEPIPFTDTPYKKGLLH